MSSMHSLSSTIKVLGFDVFGTIVDWHGSIQREIAAVAPNIDADAFALAWRAGYQPAMQRVRSGELGWTRIDDLHRMILDRILPEFGLQHFDEPQRQHLNLAWHRLRPWADSSPGLRQLRQRFTTCSLSNGNLGLLTDLAKNGSLTWDCLLSAEVFRAYQPDPATYLGVASVFDVKPEEVMLVAAHHDDLAAARQCGLRTAYIERPLEFGVSRPKDVSPQADNDMHARDLIDLANQLGCTA